MTTSIPVSSDAALAAASVLAEALPTPSRISARLADGTRPVDVDPALARASIMGTFVGARSFDLALALQPGLVPATPAAASGAAIPGAELPLERLVETALGDAATRFGEGVLGELVVDDASRLFADPATTVVELLAADALVGLFAVRGRAVASRQASDSAVAGRLQRISGVEMTLTVQIGRTRMSVRDVLGLEAGAIVELDRSAGSPADILLNGRLIAHGEVVVVDQDYAVRITRILDTADAAA